MTTNLTHIRRHILQLDVVTSAEILSEFSSAKEEVSGQPITCDSLDLASLGGVRDYYFCRRSAALEIILELCRVARDNQLDWSAHATDCLADLFSTVEALGDAYVLELWRTNN